MVSVAYDGDDNFIRRLFHLVFRPFVFIYCWFFRRSENDPARQTRARSSGFGSSQTNIEDSVDDSKEWSESRLEVCERLWGEGCLTPFNSAFTVDALRLIEVDETKSMLQLGAAMGGVARAVVDDIGVWVSGYEENEELAEIAKLRSKMAGMSKKAAITRFNPAKTKFKKNSFNVAVAYECLTSMTDKEQLFRAVEESLRLDGHFIMTDFVVPNADPPNEAMVRWINHEKTRPHLWTSRKVYDTLNEMSFDVRIAEDITDKYRSMVFTGWLNLLSHLTKKELTPELGQALIGECEYWIYRISALDSGGLKVYRYHAIKCD